jgi:cell division protease FtsH
MLSNEKLTPTVDEPLIKHELEARIKMLLGGIVASDIKYGEHASNAKVDLDEAKELVSKMLQDYGMGSSLISVDEENITLMSKLYNETKLLLESLTIPMQAVEDILNERESITKTDVKKEIDAIF